MVYLPRALPNNHVRSSVSKPVSRKFNLRQQDPIQKLPKKKKKKNSSFFPLQMEIFHSKRLLPALLSLFLHSKLLHSLVQSIVKLVFEIVFPSQVRFLRDSEIKTHKRVIFQRSSSTWEYGKHSGQARNPRKGEISVKVSWSITLAQSHREALKACQSGVRKWKYFQAAASLVKS